MGRSDSGSASGVDGSDEHPVHDHGPQEVEQHPETRLRGALTATYGYFRRNHQLLANVYRDAELPAVASNMAGWVEMLAALAVVLNIGWTGGNARIRAAALGHSLDFNAWRSLALTQGLSDAEAVDTMTRFVKAVAD